MVITACLCSHSMAQSGPDNVSATNAIDAFINYTVSPGYLLYGIPESSGVIVGNAYLKDDWKKATLKLTGNDREYIIQQCKVNLYSNQIEINYNNSVKAIDGSKVENFTLYDGERISQRLYRNASQYKIKGIAQIGFLEILVDGTIPLLKKTGVIIKKPDYNIQLNVGSKNTKIIKEEILYVVKDKELISIKSIKKKKFPLIFGNSASMMSKFIEDNSLRFSDEEDLTLIFKHYNQEVLKKEGD
jgi:hypothetical protein